MRQPLCSGCYTSSCCASPPLQRSLPGVSFSLPRSLSDGCSQALVGISLATKSSALVLECPCWSLQISILPWNSSLACSPALVFACAALRSSSEPLSSLALRPSYHFSFAHHRHPPHSCAWSPSLLLSSLLISPTVLPTLGWILASPEYASHHSSRHLIPSAWLFFLLLLFTVIYHINKLLRN